MATNFPSSLDALTNPSSTDSMATVSHSGQHADANDAIEALQAKVGVDSSAVTTSLDYRVGQLELGGGGGGASVTVSDTAPSSPTEGDLWFESDTGDIFVYYDSAWIDVGGSSVANISVSATAPTTGIVNGDLWFDTDTAKTYVYYDDGTSTQWVEVGAASAAASGVDGAVQFASGGTFSSDDANLHWDDTNNRLGIGTTSPSTALEVSSNTGGGTTSTDLRISSTGQSSTWSTSNAWGVLDFYNADGSGGGAKSHASLRVISNDALGEDSDLEFHVTDNSATDITAMTIQGGTGNVGIGTTTPGAPLEVADNINAVVYFNDTAGTKGADLNAKLWFQGSGVNSGVVGFNNTAQGIMVVTNEDGPLQLTTKANDNLLLRTNDSTRVTVTGAGDVGIGTTSPDTDLHIQTASNTMAHFESTDGEALIAFSDNSSTGNWYDRRLGVVGEQMVFITNNARRMTISDLGRIGIGNDDPDVQNGNEYMLDIRSFGSASGCINMDASTTVTTAGIIKGYSNVGGTNNLQFVIRTDGDFESRTNSYGAISDVAMKQDIVDAPSQWDDIKAVRLRKYRLIGDVTEHGDDAVTQLGVIAQELQASGMGGLVVDADPDNDKQYKTVKYSVLELKALGALQEAMERIESLEARIAVLDDLTARIEALEAG